MLKIYFDWNCITHSKDKYPYILKMVDEYGDKFIFPFSNAHIRDILVSHKGENEYFDIDLKLLEKICGKHYLLFEKGQMMPKFATPREVLDISGSSLEAIQKFELLSPDMYSSIKETIKVHLPSAIYKKIQGADPKDVISTIDMYISKCMPSQTLESLLSLFQPNLGHLIDAESRFKSMCLALDLYGFRSEKKHKQIMNIDADASHIFYGGHCDVFVTADSKLRGKAEAMYQKYNYKTKILTPEEFESFINDELQKEYSFKYISEVIDNYGIPRIEDDGAHYKLLPNHIFGMFNACMKIDKYWGYNGGTKVGLFRYYFNNTPYLFYTEITRLCEFIKNLLPSSQKEIFNKSYVQPITSHNYEEACKANYTLDFENLDIQLILRVDPESKVPTPMMFFVQGDKFEGLYNNQVS